MGQAYVVGRLTVKDPAVWNDYRSKVPGTLGPWDAELEVRGQKAGVLTGANAHTDVVVIRFPKLDAANRWYASAACQALVPIRERAASIDILIYDARSGSLQCPISAHCPAAFQNISADIRKRLREALQKCAPTRMSRPSKALGPFHVLLTPFPNRVTNPAM